MTPAACFGSATTPLAGAIQISVRIYLALGGLLFFCFVFAHQRHFDGPTPAARLDLLHALLEQQAVSIDAYHTNTPDKAVFKGHYYSDKAPGTVAVALPAFALSIQVLSLAGIPSQSRTGWLVSSWFACAAALAVITALGAAALFAWLSHFAAPRAALITVLALFLGAAPLPYSTMLFSHAMVIGLICIVIWVLRLGVEEWKTESGIPRGESPRYALAGFCCGLALASEFSSGLIVAALFLRLLLVGRDGSNPGLGKSKIAYLKSKITPLGPPRRFALAALPSLLLIPAYSWVCFGTPFTLAYSHQASFPAMREGIYAIKWPDPVTAWNLLFPATRGLFFWTPFLLIAVVGYWVLANKWWRLFVLCYAGPLLQVVVISGRTWDWEAGPVLGPRLLAPMLPLLALPCALGVQRWPKVGTVLATYSVVITTLATLTDATPAANYYNPLTELQLPLLLRGELSPNLGMVAGLPPLASVALFYLALVGGVGYLWRRLPAAEVSYVKDEE